jgi:hypothetical protein
MTSTTAVSTAGAAPLELLGAALAAPGAGPATAARPAATARGSAASTTKAPSASTSKTTTRKATTRKAGTAAAKKTTTGYATRLPADYAFLRDPKLSIEEKLSRFIGMLLAKSEQDLLRQMEKMAPGSTAASAGAGGATGGGSASKPAARKVSIWSLAKSILPPLGLASQLVGDATLKKLVQQLSGPVLGAAATALGGPALGALASQVGPSVGELVTRDVKVDLSGLASLVGLDGGAKGSGTSAASGSSTAAGGTAAQASGADGSTSEKAQLMELQRLQDRDKELFTLFSNMLKAMHDARMTSIQNIR